MAIIKAKLTAAERRAGVDLRDVLGTRKTRKPRAATRKKPRSTMVDVRNAKAAFDAHRDRRHAAGMERVLAIVGYADGREPFRILGRVSADLGLDEMPDPPLTMAEMQPVAFAAKMAIGRVLRDRKRR